MIFHIGPDQATVGAFVVGALALLGAFLRWVWPPMRGFFTSLDTMFQTINGKPAKVDKAGREVLPPEPSLRVQLADLHQAISDQTEQNRRLTAIEEIQAQHGKRLTTLEQGAQVERVVTKLESAQAWAAVEAVAKQEPDPDVS